MQERSNLEYSLRIFSKLKNEFDEISELLDLYAKEDQTSEEFEDDILLSLTNLSEILSFNVFLIYFNYFNTDMGSSLV